MLMKFKISNKFLKIIEDSYKFNPFINIQFGWILFLHFKKYPPSVLLFDG